MYCSSFGLHGFCLCFEWGRSAVCGTLQVQRLATLESIRIIGGRPELAKNARSFDFDVAHRFVRNYDQGAVSNYEEPGQLAPVTTEGPYDP